MTQIIHKWNNKKMPKSRKGHKNKHGQLSLFFKSSLLPFLRHSRPVLLCLLSTFLWLNFVFSICCCLGSRLTKKKVIFLGMFYTNFFFVWRNASRSSGIELWTWQMEFEDFFSQKLPNFSKNIQRKKKKNRQKSKLPVRKHLSARQQ